MLMLLNVSIYLCSGTVYKVKEEMINSNGEGQEKFGGFDNEDVHRRDGKLKAGRHLDRESKNAEEKLAWGVLASSRNPGLLSAPLSQHLSQEKDVTTGQLSSKICNR